MLEYDRKRLGKHLKELRKASAISQGAAARKLGYTNAQFISNIERGVSVVPLEMLRQMLELYNADAKEAEQIIIDGAAEVLRRVALEFLIGLSLRAGD